MKRKKVVGLPAQREAINFAIKEFHLSERKACRFIALERSSLRYQKRPDKNVELKERMTYWSEKRKRRFRSEARSVLPAPVRPNQIWSMDFISDQLSVGRRVRGLTVIDVFSKMNHALEFDYCLNGFRVIQILENICEFEETPEVITVDNGPEFICLALDKWANQKGVKLHFSRPGKPTDNAFIESFNGRVRDKFLNMHWFLSLEELKEKAMNWSEEYNTERPHSSLKMKTPKEFLEMYDKDKYAM